MECNLSPSRDGFRYGLVASGWPSYGEQDTFFRDVQDMRDSASLAEWAVVLFNRWAPPDAVAVDPTGCDRHVLRSYLLHVPDDPRADVNEATRFWIAAWWRRLYGPLIPFERLYRLIRGFKNHNTRPFLAAAARLGPGVFDYQDPADFCWRHHLYTSIVGLSSANCICDGLY